MSGDDGTVIACSLEPGTMPERLSRWRAVLDEVVERQEIGGGVQLCFRPGRALAAELGRLAAAEQECCPFFVFDLHIGPGALDLAIRAPADAAEIMTSLFGTGSQALGR
jgi:hypothetical protein